MTKYILLFKYNVWTQFKLTQQKICNIWNSQDNILNPKLTGLFSPFFSSPLSSPLLSFSLSILSKRLLAGKKKSDQPIIIYYVKGLNGIISGRHCQEEQMTLSPFPKIFHIRNITKQRMVNLRQQKLDTYYASYYTKQFTFNDFIKWILLL